MLSKHKPGMKHKIVYEVSKGIMIQLLPVTYYVATKLEAIWSRGGDDLRFSHDFEDLVFILNYSREFEGQFASSVDMTLKTYLREQFQSLIERPCIMEEVLSSLPYGESESSERILSLMRRIAGD